MQREVGFLSGSFRRTLMISAILLAPASLAMADIPAGEVSTINWACPGSDTSCVDWETAAGMSSVTFTIAGESSTDLGIDGYVNNFCYVPSGSCGDPPPDPLMSWDPGDPGPYTFPGVGGTIKISVNENEISYCNGTEEFPSFVCNGSGNSDQLTVDFSTPWESTYDGVTFTCGGTAFVNCGFQADNPSDPSMLFIRFDGPMAGTPAAVPEPGSWVLLLSAAAALLARAGRLKKRSC
jgi:hypothetical protein